MTPRSFIISAAALLALSIVVGKQFKAVDKMAERQWEAWRELHPTFASNNMFGEGL